MNTVETLNKLYDIALESSGEKEFYMNIHRYYDFIYKNPKFEQLLNANENDYSLKHADIWSENRAYTEEELDIKDQQTYKMEATTLWAVASLNIMRIYYPLHIYFTTNEPDNKQDYVAVILIKGLQYAKKLNWKRLNINKKEITRTYNSWFNGKRSIYEKSLRDTHSMFLVKLSENTEPVIDTPFTFDPTNGNFRYYNTTGVLSIKTQAYKLFNTLWKSKTKQATYEELLHSFAPNLEATKVNKPKITEVIKGLKKKFGILPKTRKSNPDIFVNTKQQGYSLKIPNSETPE